MTCCCPPLAGISNGNQKCTVTRTAWLGSVAPQGFPDGLALLAALQRNMHRLPPYQGARANVKAAGVAGEQVEFAAR
jgi:hypothetical protein